MDNQILIMIIVFGTLVSLAVIGYLAFKPVGATPKQHKKRLDKLRERHSFSDETRAGIQMRKILTRQDNKLDNIIGQILPRPAELRRRLARTGKSWTMGQYGTASGGILIFVTAVLGFLVKLPFFLAFVVGVFLAIALPHMRVGQLLKKRSKNLVPLFTSDMKLCITNMWSMTSNKKVPFLSKNSMKCLKVFLSYFPLMAFLNLFPLKPKIVI